MPLFKSKPLEGYPFRLRGFKRLITIPLASSIMDMICFACIPLLIFKFFENSSVTGFDFKYLGLGIIIVISRLLVTILMQYLLAKASADYFENLNFALLSKFWKQGSATAVQRRQFNSDVVNLVFGLFILPPY